MLHFSSFSRCSWLTTHHADKGYQTLNELCIGMGTTAFGIIETVFETDADGGGSHADGAG